MTNNLCEHRWKKIEKKCWGKKNQVEKQNKTKININEAENEKNGKLIHLLSHCKIKLAVGHGYAILESTIDWCSALIVNRFTRERMKTISHRWLFSEGLIEFLSAMAAAAPPPSAIAIYQKSVISITSNSRTCLRNLYIYRQGIECFVNNMKNIKRWYDDTQPHKRFGTVRHGSNLNLVWRRGRECGKKLRKLNINTEWMENKLEIHQQLNQ